VLRLSTTEVGHLTASDDGFEPNRDVSGDRILLVDDTFTTGARVQSAASTLACAGAIVVGIVPIGRVIKPEFSETVREYWERQRDPGRSFTFDRCCLE
jgi:adenine/guanine phosphoribosyltransferase-like PRPP-binding protein